jgi:hypothetical protein
MGVPEREVLHVIAGYPWDYFRQLPGYHVVDVELRLLLTHTHK